MDTHESLYKAVMDAINELYSDTSVPQSKTKEDLESIQGEINTMLDALEI